MSVTALTYFGILRSVTSWSKVARELLAALIRQGVTVNTFERRGFLYDAAFELPPELKNSGCTEFLDDLVITFENPKVYHLLPEQSFNIGLLVYEFTQLPEFWVAMIERHLDLVFVPSSFCREVFIKAGVAPEKVKQLRYGFNPDYYYPRRDSAKADAPFTFLSAAAPHKREGIELLLHSYQQAFSRSDPVRLLLKLSYLPGAKPKSFECQDLPRLLKEFQNSVELPRLEFITTRLSEPEMGALYRLADAYVSLSRGEAFGLCFLEALASGLPVAGIPWSGQTELLNSENAALILFREVAACGEEYEPAAAAQLIAQPDLDSAAKALKEIYGRGRIVREAGRGLVGGANYWHWDCVAEEFRAIISSSFK